METKSPPQRKLLKRRKVLQDDELAPNRSRRKPASALVASAKLPDRKLRQLIRCYAEEKSPKEAMEACGVSHVTVKRTYQQIRERLIVVGLYQPKIVPGAPAWYQTQYRPGLVKEMREAVRPHRGVRNEKIDPYYAETMYRRENDTTPAQLYRLILKAIADTGPLNREPELVWPAAFMHERLRLVMAKVREEICASDSPPYLKAMAHHIFEDFEQEQEKQLISFRRSEAKIYPK